MFYWITVPLLKDGSFAVGMIAALKIFWFGSATYLFGGRLVTDVLVELAIAFVFICGVTVGAIISLRRGKWISTVGFFVKLARLTIFLVLAGISVVSGSSKGAHVGVADLVPANWGLIALPTNQLTAVGSFLNAFHAVNGVLPAPLATGLGWLVALGFAASLFASGVTLLIAVSRTYAIAALDRAAPLRLGRFSRAYGTPIVATILSGILATVTVIASLLVAAFGSESIGTLFAQVLGVAISIALLAYLLMFLTFLILHYTYPAVPRPYRVPGGLVGAWIVTLLPMAYVGIACYFLLIPSDVYLQNNHLDRLTFELSHFVPLACIVLLTIVLYVWGQSERQNRDVLPDLDESFVTEG